MLSGFILRAELILTKKISLFLRKLVTLVINHYLVYCHFIIVWNIDFHPLKEEELI